MKAQEIDCIRQCLGIQTTQIDVFDLTACITLSKAMLQTSDVVIIGGSGNYSVAEGGPWWDSTVHTLQLLHEKQKPTFGSCWGFQALARAFGGVVVTDTSRAEVGTVQVSLTEHAGEDPVFGGAPSTFAVQAGHQDVVEQLPDEAIALASNERVQHQAMKFLDRPVYGTQFHPELNRESLLQRIAAYPQYVEQIAGMSLDEFVGHCMETPDACNLLRRFVQHYTP
jgi:GMP synthase (glutamine-hydrolysing)